jgi:hypothetical protein
MATMAIKIKFTTPTASRGARVVASAARIKESFSYAYNHELSTEQNAQAGARSAILDLGWGEHDFVLAELDSATYVASIIPDRYIKARDAVIAVRKAVSRGDLNGNPHCKEWCQKITDLTDGIQPGGFALEYTRSI